MASKKIEVKDMITIQSSVYEKFPSLKLAVLKVEEADSIQSDLGSIRKVLLEACESTHARWADTDPSQIPVISKWRSRFKKFRNPKGAASSIENLIRRCRSGKFPSSISPMVDLVNAMSLKYEIPLGGEDLKKLAPRGDIYLELMHASGLEPFYPLGAPTSADPEFPLQEELIYADAHGTVCRALNWRECQRTCITSSTRDALFVTEVIDPDESNLAVQALTELGRLITQHCGGRFENV